MKFEVNVNKKHMFAFVFLLVAFSALFFVYAYDSNPANPATFGHTPSETGPGSNQNWGGSSTYGGGSSSKYYYPGQLVLGGASNGWPFGPELFVGDSDSSGDAGVVIASSATGRSYIDFFGSSSTSPKANIAWDGNGNSFAINSLLDSRNTIINPYNGSVGIGKTPTNPPSGAILPHKAVLDVYGAVCLNGVCKGDGTSNGKWATPIDESVKIASLTPGAGGAGYQESIQIITPVNQGYTSGGSASFCALSQIDISGTTSTPGAGCYVYMETGLWKIKAYRNNINQGVSCRAICLHNE